ncbi:glycosyltransferase, partial [Thiolapillus sp.]
SMKVLHVGKYYPPFHGGMETFLQALAQEQSRAGHDIQVLVHNHCNRSTVTNHDQGIRITRVGSLGRVFFTPISPAFRSELKKSISGFLPDIIHLHLPNPSAFWVMTLAAASHIPWLVHWHSDVVSSELDWRVKLAYRFYRPMEQALLKRSRRVVVTSPPYLESSEPLSPWKEKCRVIPLGMAHQKVFPASRTSTPWNLDALKVLAVGRLTYYKGFDYLIRALVPLENIQLVIVGNGERQGDLQCLVEENKLSEKVKLVGKQTDEQLFHWLETCDCLCLPSIERTEAFGMVLLEAAQAGKPAVVTSVEGSGMSWVVKNGTTGLVVPPADAAALAAALEHLDQHKTECKEMGIRAAKRFATMFRIEAIEKQVSDLYDDILSKPSS